MKCYDTVALNNEVDDKKNYWKQLTVAAMLPLVNHSHVI